MTIYLFNEQAGLAFHSQRYKISMTHGWVGSEV